MIPVSEIAKRLQALTRHPPPQHAGREAARRAMQRTNAALAQAGTPVRVAMTDNAERVRFSFVTQPGPSKPYGGLTPRQLLQRNLQQELEQARAEVVRETKRVLSG
jgi:2-polyprenyl-6-methoxyphenol hydroxylase-like FAD-dependent oxidoreductase